MRESKKKIVGLPFSVRISGPVSVFFSGHRLTDASRLHINYEKSWQSHEDTFYTILQESHSVFPSFFGYVFHFFLARAHLVYKVDESEIGRRKKIKQKMRNDEQIRNSVVE